MDTGTANGYGDGSAFRRSEAARYDRRSPRGRSPQATPVAVLPSSPQSGSVIEIDAAGEDIRAVLNLESHSVDGWAGTTEQGVGGLVAPDPHLPWAARLPKTQPILYQ